MLRPQVFPILEYDEDPHALINPSDHFSAGVLPERAVLCFFPDVMHMLQEEDELTEITRLQGEYGQAPIYRIQRHNQEIALLNPLVGAPLAAGNLEEAIALGARKILACGGGGRIRKELTAGHLLLPTEAVRDEGMSYHYLPPSRTVVLNPRCVEAVAEFLKEAGVSFLKGKTWTTDAFYRETPGRIAHRREEGCLLVEMECAALAAVAQFRGVDFAQILYGGDDVSGETWSKGRWKRYGIRRQVLELTLDAVLAL